MHGGRDDNGFLRQLSDDEFPWIAAARIVEWPEHKDRQFRYNLRCRARRHRHVDGLVVTGSPTRP